MAKTHRTNRKNPLRLQTLSLTPDSHASAVVVFGRGVLIAGPPGSGKSSLSLGLIDRGHALFADDLVFLSLENKKIIACRPESAPIMAQRDIGLFNPQRVVKQDQIRIDLTIWLDQTFWQKQPISVDAQRRHRGQILSVNFAEQTLPGYALPANGDLLTNCLLLEQLVLRLNNNRGQ